MEENAEHIVRTDAYGNTLAGSGQYCLHLPPNIPAKQYWSIVVYDKETSLVIKTKQSWPSVFSTHKGLVINQDGSLDVWFGPEAPDGKVNNWIQTLPGKGWIMILRLYGILETWHDQTWKPGKVELIKTTQAINS